MDPANLGLILDSSIAIEAERQGLTVAQFLRQIMQITGESAIAISSVTVAELAHGVHRANTVERRERRRIFLDELKAALLIHAFTGITAELAGRIGAESAARGITIPFDDLLIGCCALERGYAIATRNLRHFKTIPGLQVFHI